MSEETVPPAIAVATPSVPPEAPVDREAFWRDTLARWKASGLSQKEFSEKHGLKVTNLSWWKREIRRRDRQRARPEAPPPRKPARKAAPSAGFLPVRVLSARAPADSALEIVLPDGLSVRVAPGFDPEALRKVLGVLGARP